MCFLEKLNQYSRLRLRDIMYSHYKPKVLGFKKNSRKQVYNNTRYARLKYKFNAINNKIELWATWLQIDLHSLFFSSSNRYFFVRLSPLKFKIRQFFLKHKMGYNSQKSFSLPLKPLGKSTARWFKLLSATGKASLKKSPQRLKYGTAFTT